MLTQIEMQYYDTVIRELPRIARALESRMEMEFGRVEDDLLIHAPSCTWAEKGSCSCGMDAAYDLGMKIANASDRHTYEDERDVSAGWTPPEDVDPTIHTSGPMG